MKTLSGSLDKFFQMAVKLWGGGERLCGMPLGNYTSQFFCNVYLGRLDHFVKNFLKAKYYIRYVDDFVILHNSKKQLRIWRNDIGNFLRNELKLILHPQKTKIFSLTRGIDFVGFRNFAHYKLLRKRNIQNMKQRIKAFEKNAIGLRSLTESYQGWQAYASWANTQKLRKNIKKEIIDTIWERV